MEGELFQNLIKICNRMSLDDWMTLDRDRRYVEWICRAEDLVLAEDRTTEDDRKLIMEARQKAAEKMKKLSKTNKNDSVETNSLDDTEGKKNVSLNQVLYCVKQSLIDFISTAWNLLYLFRVLFHNSAFEIRYNCYIKSLFKNNIL